MNVTSISSSVQPLHKAPVDVEALKRGNLSPEEQRTAVASQFEAIMMRQFLQESVGSMMGGAAGGVSGNVYGYMLTDSLAQKLTEGGGMGLAPMIAKQLTPRGKILDAATEPEKP